MKLLFPSIETSISDVQSVKSILKNTGASKGINTKNLANN